MSSNEKEAVATSATTPSDVDAEFYQVSPVPLINNLSKKVGPKKGTLSVVQLEIQKRNMMRVQLSLHIQLQIIN